MGLEEEELWKAAGKRLAAARTEAGFLTQKTFASAYGVSDKTIAKYEQGQREIPIRLLHWLSMNFNIDANWIITARGHPEWVDSDLSSADRNEARLLELFRKLPESAHESALAMLVHAQKLAER